MAPRISSREPIPRPSPGETVTTTTTTPKVTTTTTATKPIQTGTGSRAPIARPTTGKIVTAAPAEKMAANKPTTLMLAPSADVSEARIKLGQAKEEALYYEVPQQQIDDIDTGIVGSVFNAANSVLNFKIPGTKIRPAYLPFYPVDKLLEIENLIPGIINQIQNANEGKPVDVGSFTDPFGNKGIVTELGRMFKNAPRETQLFQESQEQKGYSQVVDNPALALTMDVFLAPSTWLTGGGTGVSKTFLKAIASGGIKKAITETGEALTKAGAKKLAADAALKAAQAAADDAARQLAEGIITKEAKAVADAAVKAAEKTVTKRAAAVAAEEAAPDVLLRNAEDFARTAAPRRIYGARAREDLATIVIDAAETAAKTLDEVAAGTLKLTPTQLARVRALDTVLNKTPGVLDSIINRGYAGIRGPIAEALYTKGGFRFGAGKFKTPVFGEGLSNLIGTGVSTVRLGTKPMIGAEYIVRGGLAGSEAGKAFIEWTTNLGKKGIAGEGDIRGLRSALRTGELTGQRAITAVKELSLDKIYRRNVKEVVQQLDFVASPIFANSADSVFSNTVEELIINTDVNLFDAVRGGVRVAADDAATVSAKVGRTVTEQELNFARRAKASFNEIYDVADEVYVEVQLKSGVKPADVKHLPKNENWFPHVLSDKAKNLLRKTKSKEYDELMGFDRTFLGQLSTPRRLVPGSKVGTYTLTAADIAGGTKALNKIMRRELGINFDWFATDIGEALANQVDNIASDIAFLKTLETELKTGSTGLIKPVTREEVAAKPFAGDIAAVVETSLTPQRIAAIKTIPDAVEQLDEIVSTIEDINVRLLTPGSVLSADDIEESIQRVRQMADALARDPNVTASMGSVITLEADSLAELLTREAKAISSRIDFRPITDFKKVKAITDDGFIELNKKILPGVQAQREIAAMVQNFRRLEDPRILRLMNNYIGKYNRLFKSWVTATPGFHVRNAYSNAFFMATAGADFRNIDEALDIYDRWLKFGGKVKKIEEGGIEKGIITKPSELIIEQAGRATTRGTIGQIIGGGPVPGGEALINNFIVSPVNKGGLGLTLGSREATAAKTALENVGVAGFGRVGEVFEGAGTGFRGIGATGATARNKLSEIIGTPLTWSRNAGNTIENYSRFALTYDGIKKGLSAEQAAGRTAKYLIDYSDISRADEVLKQIIPFWMWMSRSLPLMLEILTTNPKAYTIYQKIKNGLRDEEGESDLMPLFMQTQGAFKAPFNLGGSSYLMPDLGLTGLAEDIGGFTSPGGVLASLNPAIRTPLEYWLNYDAFRKEQIANKEFDPEADAKLRKYLAKNITILGPVLQRYGRAGAAIAEEIVNADSVAEFIRDATRTGTPAYLAEPEQGGITEPSTSQNVSTISRFFGLPLSNLEPYQEVNEAERRIEELNRLIALQKIKEERTINK